ncbi:hypothetical protein QVD17_11780 [Tagetes erecta]|uniref:Uncharacterized protein n=1 Tax=Tagetes erecta TaxID=13708 RepID=A0AAD8L090_TARER|nr:hypothetical protein QVD17_11780 [Tagetes erecta]
MHRSIATSISGCGKGTNRVTTAYLLFLRCLLTHPVTSLVVWRITLPALSQLPSEGVALSKANCATAVGMRIVRKFLDNQWRLVGSYDVLDPWVPEPLVDLEQLVVAEVQIKKVKETADREDESVPPTVEPVPLQHPQCVYRAVRLPTFTQEMILDTQTWVVRMEDY